MAITGTTLNCMLLGTALLAGIVAIRGETWNKSARWYRRITWSGWLTVMILVVTFGLGVWKERRTRDEMARKESALAKKDEATLGFRKRIESINKTEVGLLDRLHGEQERTRVELTADLGELEDALEVGDKERSGQLLAKITASLERHFSRSNDELSQRRDELTDRSDDPLPSRPEYEVTLYADNVELRRQNRECQSALELMREAGRRAVARFLPAGVPDHALPGALDRIRPGDPQLAAAHAELEAKAIQLVARFGKKDVKKTELLDELGRIEPQNPDLIRELRQLRADVRGFHDNEQKRFELAAAKHEALRSAVRDTVDRFMIVPAKDENLEAQLKRVKPPSPLPAKQLAELRAAAKAALARFGFRNVADENLVSGLRKLAPQGATKPPVELKSGPLGDLPVEPQEEPVPEPAPEVVRPSDLALLRKAVRIHVGNQVPDRDLPKRVEAFKLENPKMVEELASLRNAATRALGRFDLEVPKSNLASALERLKPGNEALERAALGVIDWYHGKQRRRSRTETLAQTLTGVRNALPDTGSRTGRDYLSGVTALGAELRDARTATGALYRTFRLDPGADQGLPKSIREFGEKLAEKLKGRSDKARLELNAVKAMLPVVLGPSRARASQTYWAARIKRKSRVDALRAAVRADKSHAAVIQSFRDAAGDQYVERVLESLENYPLGWKIRTLNPVR